MDAGWNARFEKTMARYRGKRVMVLYSAGWDSSFLAYYLVMYCDCTVTLLLCNSGAENDPASPTFDPREPVEPLNYVEQYKRYAAHLVAALPPAFRGRISTVETNLPTYNALTVNPSNLLAAPHGSSAAHDEAVSGLVFYSGIVLLQAANALALAGARGIDWVLTGHMDWNDHYADESEEFFSTLNNLFQVGYGSRLKRVPRIDAPFRRAGVTKTELIKYGATGLSLDSRATISCSTSALDRDESGNVASFRLRDGYQIHCGRCTNCLERKASFEAAGITDRAYFE